MADVSRGATLSRLYPPGTTLTAVLAIVGGLVFTAAGFPAPLLLGPLAATLTAALAGLRLAYPRWLQLGVLGVIGINVGGSLRPETLAQADLWLPSIAGEIAALLLALTAASLVMRYVARQSVATAFLASYPGHLMMVLAAAAEGRADDRVVAIAQSLRLVVLVAAIPLLFGEAAPEAAPADLPPLEILDVLGVVAAGLAGIALAARVRFPTAILTGGIFGAGLASVAGLSLGPVPDLAGDWLLAVVGAMIGARFAGSSRRMLLASFPMCGLTVAVMLLTMAAVAWPLSLALDLPFGQLLLAYSPGGADVMPLLALTQGYDAVFVGIHHAARLLVMAIVLPLAARLYSVETT